MRESQYKKDLQSQSNPWKCIHSCSKDDKKNLIKYILKHSEQQNVYLRLNKPYKFYLTENLTS